MTSVATAVGYFPSILVPGAGPASPDIIGYILVTGMTIGTVFTLFVVPSIYVLIAKDHAKARVSNGKTEWEPEEARS
jgi:multidrug efflux pump